MKKNILTALLLLISVGLQAQEKGTLLIKNGTVLTITNGIKENSDVLIKDGKIQKIGTGLKAPSGADVIDAKGMYVMPGIIDAHSHIALSAINEATSPVTAEVSTGDAVNPLDIAIYRALAGGVTLSHAMHGSANAIGGQCETIKHRYGTVDPEELKMKGAPRTIKFALGENPTRVHGSGNGILPRTRMGVEEVFRNSFSEANEYMAGWNEYNAKKNQKSFKGVAPKYDLRLETLADILKGNIIIHCHSYRADEIYMLMQVCKDYGIKRLVFQHVNEGFKVAPELAEFGAMASVFSDWWAYKFEVYYSTAYNATILTENNVVTSINSDSRELIRHLYHEAAKTQKYGSLPNDKALSLITINPAKQLGIDDRVGSLEEGKEGDVAIFKNHPLSIYAVPMYTIVDGIVEFDRENDPADMRIYPNPEEQIDVTIAVSDSEYDRCMQDTEFLFNH
ncbi:MAG: amidohydrolase family protein [Bacteroidota bacterium]